MIQFKSTGYNGKIKNHVKEISLFYDSGRITLYAIDFSTFDKVMDNVLTTLKFNLRLKLC